MNQPWLILTGFGLSGLCDSDFKLAAANWGEFSVKLPQLDLPNSWKPRADQFYHIEALPVLGTGKLDLRTIRELAAQFSKGETGG